MKIYRGTILTLDGRNTIANTLVEDRGRIVYVGDLRPRQYRFHRKAEEILPEKYRDEQIRADVIVVDPPRKGCERSVLDTMLAMAPERIGRMLPQM